MGRDSRKGEGITGLGGGGVRWWRVVLTILLLTALAAFVDLPAALHQLRGAELVWMLAALLVVQLQIVGSAWRWRMTAARLGLPLTPARAVREYYIASLGNLSLPGGVGGDAARAWRVRDRAGLGVAVNSVVLERLAGQLALVFVTLTGLAAALWLLASHQRRGLEVSGWFRVGFYSAMLVVAVSVLAMLVVWMMRRRRLPSGHDNAGKPVTTHGMPASRLRTWLSSLWPAMQRAWFTDRQWLPQTVLSIVIVASYVIVFALCARSLDVTLPLLPVLVLVPLVLSSMVLPISTGGWGVRETAAAVLLPMAGLSAADSVTVSVMYGLVILVGSLPGALFLLFESSR